MADDENAWYTRQATISKFVTYAAILIFLGSIGGAGYVLAYAPSTAHYESRTTAIFCVIGGMAIAALLAGLSALIDLLIVQAVALHDLRGK